MLNDHGHGAGYCSVLYKRVISSLFDMKPTRISHFWESCYLSLVCIRTYNIDQNDRDEIGQNDKVKLSC